MDVNAKDKDSKTPPVPEQPIPEGFFDDPILDAKVGTCVDYLIIFTTLINSHLFHKQPVTYSTLHATKEYGTSQG